MAGIVLVAGVGLTPPASADPELVLPDGAHARPTPEVVPAPSPESLRVRQAVGAAMAAPEAAGTVTISPDTALVHEQVVTVHGTGWEPRAFLVVLQCGPAPGGPGDCEWELDEFRAGPGGGFTTDTTVDVIIDNPRGAIDCRVVTCRLGVLDVSSPELGLRFTDLAFDPAGPDPVHPALTVAPDTGLVDGDRLAVSGSGIEPIADFLPFGQLTFCRTPVVDAGDCDRHLTEIVELGAGGSVDTETWATPVLDLRGGAHDCRTGSCAVVVVPYDLGPDEWGELSEAAIGEIDFDPAGPLRPPPTVTADPDSGLTDGALVEVHGSGFDPERGVYLQQCRADATSRRDCVGGVLVFSETDATGEVHAFFGVVARFRTGRGFSVDCRVDDCAIVVSHGDFGRSGRVDLDFDPDAGLLQPSITVTPSSGLHDGDEVTVTGAQWPAQQPLLLAQCPAGTPDPFYCDVDFTLIWPGLDDPPLIVPAARSRAEAQAGTGFEATFRVRAVVEGNDGRVDCRRSACELLAGDLDGVRVARAPITFDQAVEPVSASPTFTG